MSCSKLLAVDPSITCSGWALFNLDSESLLGVGKIKPLPASEPLSVRLADLNEKIDSIFKQLSLDAKDILICESPTTMRDPSAAIKVEQVRCAFETLARSYEVRVPGRINPRSIHYEVLGLKGKQLERKHVKDLAVNTVEHLYKDALKKLNFDTSLENLKRNQDIIDAILIGHLGIARIQSAKSAKLEIEDYFDSLQVSKRTRAQ